MELCWLGRDENRDDLSSYIFRADVTAMECRLGEEALKDLVGDPEAETLVGESGGVILGVPPCEAKGPRLLPTFGTAKMKTYKMQRTKLGIIDYFQL